MILADVEHGHDIGVVEFGRGLGLAQEPFDIIRQQLAAPRDLDRYETVELRIAGLPHGAKGPLAEQLQQLEMGDPARCLRGDPLPQTASIVRPAGHRVTRTAFDDPNRWGRALCRPDRPDATGAAESTSARCRILPFSGTPG